MNLINALIVLIATIVICAALTLLLDWSWIAAHWLRQLLVAVLTISVLLLGLWIAIRNLTKIDSAGA
jgi:predicted membrane channel-forming protein YqfA (hemolysin III family)